MHRDRPWGQNIACTDTKWGVDVMFVKGITLLINDGGVIEKRRIFDMRNDYKHIIVDTARGGSEGGWHDIRNSKRVRELDGNVGYAKMNKRGWMAKEQSDRLKPVMNMLRSNIGQPWDKVWSEICQNADSRNIRGFHLRQHVSDYVRLQGKRDDEWPYWPKKFYVDDNGILRQTKCNRKRSAYRTRDPDHKNKEQARKRREKQEKKAADQHAEWVLWKRKQESKKC